MRSSSTNSKVLLVDDDPAMLRLLAQWLGSAGYDVRQAEDGQQALEAIEKECPEFLVTDWEMPKMNGLELCRRVRKLNLSHYIYILFLTIRSAQAEVIEGLEVGADDFLTKPVHRGELLARMRSGARVVELERRLALIARTDPLTKLITRRVLFEYLENEWKRAERYRLPLSCVMMDIDFFKRVNDNYGHPAGDTILKSVAKLLNESCRSSDSLCRYGGEEFCAMLPETTEEAADLWAERVRRRLASLVMPVGDRELQVTASFGVAQRRDDTQTPEQLVDQADQALLCAKQSGRDRVIRFGALSAENEVDLEKSDGHGDLFHAVTARDVMTPMLACLREDETVGQAAEFFLRSRINSTPVVDTEGRLVGILSEKDLMTAMVSLECWRAAVADVMRPNVIWYEEETPIRKIYEFLCRVSIRRVVVAKDDRPTGTISRGTLLRWFRNLVITKGLWKQEEMPQGTSDKDPYRSKQRLAETARALGQLAAELNRRLDDDAEDLVPYIVGGASRIEELVTDLLAYSRYANQDTQTSDAALRAMMLNSSHTE